MWMVTFLKNEWHYTQDEASFYLSMFFIGMTLFRFYFCFSAQIRSEGFSSMYDFGFPVAFQWDVFVNTEKMVRKLIPKKAKPEFQKHPTGKSNREAKIIHPMRIPSLLILSGKTKNKNRNNVIPIKNIER